MTEELVKDHHNILRMVRELAADDSRDHYVKQVAGSAENLIDALAAEVERLAKGIADLSFGDQRVIDRLRAENERLREALEKIVERHEFGGEHLDIARAALQSKGE